MIEQLESRVLLSTAPNTYTTASMSWDGNTVQVAQNEWLIHVTNSAALAGMQSASGVTGLGDGSSISMVDNMSPFALLIAPNATAASIQAWASGYKSILSYEPDLVVQADTLPNDPIFANESTVDGLWGLNNDGQNQLAWNGSAFVPSGMFGTPNADINAPEAWNTETGSTKTVIGIIDTGIDYTHPDLYDNIWINQGEIPTAFRSNLVDVDGDGLITFRDLNSSVNSAYVSDLNHNGYIDAGDLLADPRWIHNTDQDHNGFVDDLVGWNFVSNTNNPMDDFFHGTHVSGTIGAMGNNGVGIAGINWAVQLMALKFLNSGGSGLISDAVRAVDYSTEMKTQEGVNVVATNNSWGGGGFSQDLMNAITAAGQANILFVAAAGNSANNNDLNPVYPSTYPNDNIISVAATDSNDQLAFFSDYGATTVDLGAPGVNVLSTFPTYETAAMSADGFNTYYGTISGTSMATPHVTGVVGLLASLNPNATAAQIKQAILAGVTPDPALAGKTVTGGRLNAAASLALLPSGLTLTVSDPTDNFDGNYTQGHLSLREALYLAGQTAGNSLINFDPSLSGDTINLVSSLGQLNITSNVTIEGLGSSKLTINGGNSTRVFNVVPGATATIEDLTVTGGYIFPGPPPSNPPYSGSGIYNGGNLTLDRVVVTGNNALDGAGVGQETAGANLQIVDSTISNNTGLASPGGGLFITAGTAMILRTTISNNNSDIEGGGIYFAGSTLTLEDSTVANNIHEGVRVNGGTATILNCTITNNTPTPVIPPQYAAGGLDGNSTTTLINTIVAGNSNGDIYGTFNTSSHNDLIGDGSKGNLVNGVSGNQVGTTANPVNAQLTALGNYGGLTQTIELQPTSPAINAGDTAAAVAAALTTDQRGLTRVSNGAVDIGSVEREAPIVVTTLNDQLDTTFSPGSISLRDALFIASVQPGADTITFDPSLANGTINLSSALGQLVISSDVTINGLGSGSLTINGGGHTRDFYVNPGVNATLTDMDVTGGYIFPGPPPSNPPYSGSGIYNAGNLTLNRMLINGNNALYGAGIGQETSGANVNITNSTITNNDGLASPGGGIYINAGSAEIQDSTIYNNTSDIEGGGIYFNGSSLLLTNSTISGNIHEGIRIASGSATIVNCTITNNTPTPVIPPQYAAGGLDGNSTTTLINTIVAGNSNGDIYGTFNAASHNDLIGDGSKGNLVNGVSGNLVGTTANPINAQLLPLANNGGLTLTQLPQANSPALNAGDNAAASSFTTDQRGGPRIIGANVDIGAVETAMIVTLAIDQNNGNYSYNDLSLREALALAAATPGFDVIQFAPSLSGTTTTLDPTLGQLVISSDVQILGLGSSQLTYSGGGHTRVFYVNPGVNATITDMTVTGGYVFPGPPPSNPPYSGSGIYNGGNLTLARMVITGNNALEGAGIGQETAGANVSVTDSTISNNDGLASPGGGMYISAGSAQILRTTISNNTSNIEGGGIYFSGASLTLTNSTITGNIREGVRVNGGTATILNCTITNNTPTPVIPSQYAAGGLDGNSSTTFTNTVVAGNTGGDIYGTFNSASHNDLVGDGSKGNLVNGVNGNQVGTTANPINAQLSALGSFGGFTQTQLPLAGSPLIDAGDTSAASGLTTDQRGLARVVGSAVDIGAVESPGAIIVSTLADESDGNTTFGHLSLREALSIAASQPGNHAIVFDSSLNGGVININSALGNLVIGSNVEIDGPGVNVLAVSGNFAQRVFFVNSGVTASINNLTIEDGNVQVGRDPVSNNGGNINNRGNLTLNFDDILNGSCLLGGGIMQESSSTASLTMNGCTVQGNFAADPGAGVSATSGTVTISSSLFNNNASDIYGGGISVQGALSLLLTNSTITNNFGEGIDVAGGSTATIINCTITGNTSEQDIPPQFTAGGVAARSGDALLINTIVAQNNGGDIYGQIDSASRHNLIGDGTNGPLVNGVNGNIVGTTASPVDPKLAPLANNGGPTMTQALLFSSVAIDAGDNSAVAGLLYDQRGAGFARIKDGGHGLIVDIGAYEV